MTKILLVIAFALLVLVGFLSVRNSRQNSSSGPSGGTIVSKYQPILSSQANIDVEVTPLNISSSGAEFKVQLTTHSGSLDYDLAKQSTLEVGSLKLSALSWDGGSGGHHLLGTLKFPSIPANTKTLRLIISGAGVPERNFEWNI